MEEDWGVLEQKHNLPVAWEENWHKHWTTLYHSPLTRVFTQQGGGGEGKGPAWDGAQENGVHMHAYAY